MLRLGVALKYGRAARAGWQGLVNAALCELVRSRPCPALLLPQAGEASAQVTHCRAAGLAHHVLDQRIPSRTGPASHRPEARAARQRYPSAAHPPCHRARHGDRVPLHRAGRHLPNLERRGAVDERVGIVAGGRLPIGRRPAGGADRPHAPGQNGTASATSCSGVTGRRMKPASRPSLVLSAMEPAGRSSVLSTREKTMPLASTMMAAATTASGFGGSCGYGALCCFSSAFHRARPWPGVGSGTSP